MSVNYENVVIGLILIIPAPYLFWYANGHPSFFEEHRWDKWDLFRSPHLAFPWLMFWLAYRWGGPGAARRSLKILAVVCLGVGLWAAFSP